MKLLDDPIDLWSTENFRNKEKHDSFVPIRMALKFDLLEQMSYARK